MDRSYDILLLDDDDVDRLAVRRALGAGLLEHTLAECASVDALRTALAARAFDCLLLDFMLPGIEGQALIAELRRSYPELPIIMLTGQDDRDTAVALMKAGASDFIAKSSASAPLIAQSIRAAVRTMRAERAVRAARRARDRSERRYRFLAESIPQMVWILKGDLGVEYVNRRYSACTGYELPEVMELGITAGIHPDDVPRALARWAEARATKAAFELSHRLRSSETGAYRWHLSRAEPMVDADGVVQQWFGTSTDIDDQKRLEQRQAAQVHESEAARRHAEELNRAKDDFLAVLSHELRTPLNAILGWLQLSATSREQERVLGLSRIERNARSLARLIEDLLDVSRIVSGKFDIQRARVDLAEVLRCAAEVVLPAAEQRGIAIVLQVEAGVGAVLGDASRLQQVAWNLLTNAVHASEPGSTVVLEAEACADSLCFRVRDQGCGIDPGFLPHVFERFRQEDSSSTRRRGGLGLGLSIVKYLVEVHGGRIAAESPGPGLGATFTVTLPPAPPGTLGRQPSGLLPPVDASHDRPLDGVHVLLADDDDDSREMLMHALERSGARVVGVGSAAECRARYAEREPDVLVSDIGMPGEDGYALMADLRGRGARVFAVALTGYAAVEDRERARRAGFDAHFAKPVNIDALVAALVRAQSSPRRTMSSSSSPK
jgi:PAS domain S-box-containing protein